MGVNISVTHLRSFISGLVEFFTDLKMSFSIRFVKSHDPPGSLPVGSQLLMRASASGLSRFITLCNFAPFRVSGRLISFPS